MVGGVQETIKRASKNKQVVKRLKKLDGLVLDEVSMISGPTLRAAESIARKARGNSTSWGGIRIIAVGDFAQLPPVNPYGSKKEWAFLESAWHQSDFKPAVLNEIMRTQDKVFLEILNDIREGIVSDRVSQFLDHHTEAAATSFSGTRLLSRKDDVERFNLSKLETISSPTRSFETEYTGKTAEIEKFKKNSPIADVIHLKKGAHVMIRQNDPEGKWVNGSTGTIEDIKDESLTIKLSTGRDVEIEPVTFTLLNAEGNPVVTATNFPIALAWAFTIHKAQGTTLDRARIDLRRLWEPGQAYVALSRVKSPKGLTIEGWDRSSIVSDPDVRQFHAEIFEDGTREGTWTYSDLESDEGLQVEE